MTATNRLRICGRWEENICMLYYVFEQDMAAATWLLLMSKLACMYTCECIANDFHLMQLQDKCFTTAAHQKGTETVEAEEVEHSKVGPAGELLSWQEVRLGVTFLPIHRSHHHLLPSFSSCTSGYMNHSEILAGLFLPCNHWLQIPTQRLTEITSERPVGMSGSYCCGWLECRRLRLPSRRSEGLLQSQSESVQTLTFFRVLWKSFLQEINNEERTCIPMTA